MSKKILGVLVILLSIGTLSTILSCSLEPEPEKKTPVIGTEWKYLGIYTNNVLGYNAILIYNGVTNFEVWKFFPDRLIKYLYSNDTITGSLTQQNVSTTETSFTLWNVYFFYQDNTYYGTNFYSLSVTGNNLKMFPSSFSGTNTNNGSPFSTSFNSYDSGDYGYFEKFR